jgi:hypothetical protein
VVAARNPSVISPRLVGREAELALIETLNSTMLSRRLRLGVALPLIALLWSASLLPMVFINELWLA